MRIFLKFLLLICLCYQPWSLLAQPRPTNIKLLDEYKDGKGNLVRVVQYNQGLMRVTETIIEPLHPRIDIVVPIRMDTANRDLISIFISKSQYRLTVKYGRKPIRSYKAVFGPTPKANKYMEGDRNTPEGIFHIASKKPSSKYDKFLALDYPNDSSLARFNRMKAEGKLPSSARIGGSVGIHGVWPGGDDLIQMGVGWTDGCIAICNKDIEDLYGLVEVGTPVIIRK
ncbi:MAG: L,D-transpeptidase [Bacteroidetes bacterium]|nr:L,D-transpeptidase [Bacteroidota bacterium]